MSGFLDLMGATAGALALIDRLAENPASRKGSKVRKTRSYATYEVLDWRRERNTSSGNPMFSFELSDGSRVIAGKTKPNHSFVYGLNVSVGDRISAALETTPSGRVYMVDVAGSNPRARKSEIAVGDKVAYSKSWLNSVGIATGELPRAKGVVQKLEKFGGSMLATVAWNHPDIPPRVLVNNLAKVGSVSYSDNPRAKPSKRLKARRAAHIASGMPAGVFPNPAKKQRSKFKTVYAVHRPGQPAYNAIAFFSKKADAVDAATEAANRTGKPLAVSPYSQYVG